jgi:hypothetical protein
MGLGQSRPIFRAPSDEELDAAVASRVPEDAGEEKRKLARQLVMLEHVHSFLEEGKAHVKKQNPNASPDFLAIIDLMVDVRKNTLSTMTGARECDYDARILAVLEMLKTICPELQISHEPGRFTIKTSSALS